MCVGTSEKAAGIPRIFSKKRYLQNHDDVKKNLEDSLSYVTQLTKIVLFKIGEVFDNFQKCRSYKVLSKTTQPAHLITILAVTCVAFLYYPKENAADNRSVLLAFCYLACYGIHFGSQVWMTFVSGLSLYFSLPRHTFGSVQKVLFPKYFFTNSILSFFTLVAFMKNNITDFQDTYIRVQGFSLTVCFFIELCIRLYLTPPLISLITEKITMESSFGVGTEVGKHEPKGLARCPHYIKIHKKFRKVHMTIAIGNMLTMGCSIFHLHYLANKICANL